MASPKAYKIQCVNRKSRKGIVARNLVELKEKGIKKLCLPNSSRVCLEDGTEVEDEDYFASLPEQTVFVYVKPEETWDGYLTVLKHATEKVFKAMSQRDDIIDQTRNFMSGELSGQMYCLMAELLNRLGENIEAENREDDEDWFEGIRKSFDTKEKVMRNGAQSRIRTYFTKAKEFVEKEGNKKSAVSLLMSALTRFQEELKRQEYFGGYFVRSASKELRLCCPKGWFDCEGEYDAETCTKFHKINPYGSKEGRILFSTWNLDHIIEKSREILPAMLAAAQSCPKGHRLNWKYFFRLLFTKENLKLVHIGCHVKGEHEGYVCESKHFYEKKK